MSPFLPAFAKKSEKVRNRICPKPSLIVGKVLRRFTAGLFLAWHSTALCASGTKSQVGNEDRESGHIVARERLEIRRKKNE